MNCLACIKNKNKTTFLLLFLFKTIKGKHLSYKVLHISSLFRRLHQTLGGLKMLVHRNLLALWLLLLLHVSGSAARFNLFGESSKASHSCEDNTIPTCFTLK